MDCVAAAEGGDRKRGDRNQEAWLENSTQFIALSTSFSVYRNASVLLLRGTGQKPASMHWDSLPLGVHVPQTGNAVHQLSHMLYLGLNQPLYYCHLDFK